MTPPKSSITLTSNYCVINSRLGGQRRQLTIPVSNHLYLMD